MGLFIPDSTSRPRGAYSLASHFCTELINFHVYNYVLAGYRLAIGCLLLIYQLGWPWAGHGLAMGWPWVSYQLSMDGLPMDWL